MCGAFFIPKITVDPTDNKTGTADTGTCRNKKDRQGKEKNYARMAQTDSRRQL